MKTITIRDSGNKEVLEAYFLNHEGQPYNLENKTVTFMENKDGDKFVSDPNVQIVNATAGFVRYTLQSQVHSAPGIAWFEINDDSGLVDSTGNFNIRVENGLRATADNTTYIAALEKLKQQMEALIRQADGELKTELQRAEQQLNQGVQNFRPQYNSLSNAINQNTTDIGLNSLEIKRNSVDIQNLEGAGHLMDILLVDGLGNHITDDYGNRIGGYKWLPLTDVTLTQAGLPADGQAVGDAIRNATTFKPEKYGMPVLYLWGSNILSLKDKSKTLKNEVTYSFPAYGVSGIVEKFKVQGASSVGNPKKNYTLNLDKDFEAFRGYGKNHKYVIKANYGDPSQSLNVVGARLWGSIRNTHKHVDTGILNTNGDLLVDNNGNRIVAETDPQLSIGGTYGAVDGFPIGVYINNQYWGLYTFNIPKDDWMAKMPKKSKNKYAIIDTIWTPQGAFLKETNLKDDQMELQFCSTNDTTWAKDSVNELIRAVIASYNSVDDFNKAVSPLLDIDSAIDYYIFSVLVDNDDGIFRNYLLQTFDGKKWYFAAYDLDSIFGRTPDFLEHMPAKSDTNDWRDHGVTFENVTNANRLMYQLWKFYKDEILKRTKALVDGVMSDSAVDTAFVDFVRHIPLKAFDAELDVWPYTPNTSVDNVNRIGRWYMQRVAWLKNRYFNN